MLNRLPAQQAILHTRRLVLRPLALDDAPAVQQLAGDKEIASTTRHIPHPYPAGMAERWIATLAGLYERGEMIHWAITLPDGPLLGTIRLVLAAEDHHAEIGFWVGKPYWNKGYCTEAARAVVAYGFEELGLERIYAHCLARNAASARVLAKLGMQREGLLRRHRRKFGQYEDLVVFGLLRQEHPAAV